MKDKGTDVSVFDEKGKDWQGENLTGYWGCWFKENSNEFGLQNVDLQVMIDKTRKAK